MVKTEIRNLKKTVRTLAEFDMNVCAYCEVGVYLWASAARQLFDCNINVTEEVARWGQPEWEHFIMERAEHYRDISMLTPDEIVSIVVQFRLNPESGSIYSVENTDLSKVDGFDRFLSVTPETGGKFEVFYDEEDRKKVYGVYDAVEIVAEMGIERLRPVGSDLPYICLYSNR